MFSQDIQLSMYHETGKKIEEICLKYHKDQNSNSPLECFSPM